MIAWLRRALRKDQGAHCFHGGMIGGPCCFCNIERYGVSSSAVEGHGPHHRHVQFHDRSGEPCPARG